MADEAQIRTSLFINKNPLQYQGQPTAFTGDVTGIKGPTPGAFSASTAGTDVDLSELTTPGYCRIMNLDDVNFVTVGAWDPEVLKFYPLFELLAGESYVLRLSRDLGWEYQTGTGTVGPETNRLRVKADTAACDVVVEAFES